MKPSSYISALVYSVLILSLVVYIESFNVGTALSYGWIEAFYKHHYIIYSVISSLFVLFAGTILVAILKIGRASKRSDSYLPLIFYSFILSFAVGSRYLYVSIACLYIVILLFVIISKSRAAESIAGVLFKSVLAIFLLSLINPAMFLLIIPVAVIIIYFRPSAIKDLFILLLSFTSIGFYYLWSFWFFDLDISSLINGVTPWISLKGSFLSHIVAAGMLLFVFGSWKTFQWNMATMDSMACKLEQYSLFFIIVISLLLFFVESCGWFLSFYAIPVAIVVYIHREALDSPVKRSIVVVLFFLVFFALSAFLLYKTFNFSFDYIKSLYGRFWYGD